MVVGEASINNIMGGIQNTGGVRLHNHKRKLKQRFDIIKKLGQGTYGKVQLGINKETGQEVAIKTIKKSKIETEADLVRIRREIQIMSSVQHPNIIHIYEVFENREKMVLVMEYAAGGELYDYLSERKVLAEEEARRIFRQIATACYYCHKHKICHRDLKLENILLDETGNAKIADFGLSNVFDDTRLLSTFCGSPLYASPEIVKGTPYHGPEVDCWSLGVLLYTLVYGAMPFDGSNFKRLVKQISQGDYFEPTKPSPASPLIRDMLTVNPKARADIEKICSHWWVNEGYDESCLDISEYLANQTPVRLDLLLSLAPPPPQLESDKLVVTGEIPEEPIKPDLGAPVRSQSVGSLMELSPAEKRIKDLLSEEIKATPKRKLENAVSSDHANLSTRRDKIIKENTVADISVHGTIMENASQEDASMAEAVPLDKSRTQTLSREMDVEQTEETVDPSLQGAACAEIMEDSKKNDAKQPSKVKKTVSATLNAKVLEEINENPSQENLSSADKENASQDKENKEEKKPEETKVGAAPKKKLAKKGVLTDRDENAENAAAKTAEDKPQSTAKAEEKSDSAENQEEVPSKPIERRRSRIYEQAEKFQNLITANESKSNVSDKPKKVTLPGVSVDGYKERFERKASLTAPPKLKGSIPKRISIDKQGSIEQPEEVEKQAQTAASKAAVPNKETTPVRTTGEGKSKEVTGALNEERKKQLKNAVSIISSALDKDGTRKSKSRPCISKPPVPFGTSGRSASGSIGVIMSPVTTPPVEDHKPLRLQVGPEPKETRVATIQVSTPEQIKYEPAQADADSKTSSAEITLKSATLPRRKTTKAEIKLNYPQPKPATMEFKTEMAHHIEAPPKLATQRSEAVFPVSAAPKVQLRSASVEPESKVKQPPKERIIPISFEKPAAEEKKEPTSPTPIKLPTPKLSQSQKSLQSQRAVNSLSRQSTQESDSETTPSGSGEPIRKSPREYIIPIAVEGGGYVTPRAGSLEPSDTASTTSTMTNSSRRANKFGRARKLNSLLNERDGSEDESPFSLHRHTSFGKDSDTEDSRKDAFHMHKLRSSRPMKANLEHTDSLSSGEEDDDDGFEILTAENLFSTLLSRQSSLKIAEKLHENKTVHAQNAETFPQRTAAVKAHVRDLTQRINVEDGGRPGFPSSRLLNHFNQGTTFWNLQNRMDPFSRTTPLARTFGRERSLNSSAADQLGTPWRRSVSRDLAPDIESVFNESRTPTQTATLPRGDRKTKKDDLNLSDLNLKQLKLSEEDAIALSYLTPGLSRRIQKQLLAQLPPSEAKKLTRTMSLRNPAVEKTAPEEDHNPNQDCGATEKNTTLPRRYSVGSGANAPSQLDERLREKSTEPKSSQGKSDNTVSNDCKLNVNVNVNNRDCFSPYNDRSTKSDTDYYLTRKPRAARSASLREPRSNYLTPRISLYPRCSPDSSSISDSVSYKNDNDYSSKGGSSSIYNSDYSSLRPLAYSPESSALGTYLTPNKYNEIPRPISPTYVDLDRKTEMRKPSVTNRRVSRFLRHDFYEKPKEENVYLKEKKEREMETQKVLKEIRDKRKGRLHLRRDRSASRDSIKLKTSDDNKEMNASENFQGTNSTLNNVPTSSKTIESNVKAVPDYVNVKAVPPEEDSPVTKKERAISKLVRPKSYPADNRKQSPEKDCKSKISRLKKGFTSQSSKAKDSGKDSDTNQDSSKASSKKNKDSSPPKALNGSKNKFLHSIEKKFEKLRGFSSTPSSNEEKKVKESKEEKRSSVESAIKRLREQSLPRNMDHCITESCLIKRAVSVEDLTTLGGLDANRELQPSRKSVTKILGLFKKYEEKEKKSEKISKLKKPKEVKPKNTENVKTDVGQLKSAVIPNKNDATFNKSPKVPESNATECKENKENEKRRERPHSLLYDHVKQLQNPTGAKCDTASDASKAKTSKLPVNSFRRSLNLDNEPPKFYKQQTSRNNINEQQQNLNKNEETLNNLNGSENNNPGLRTNSLDINLRINDVDVNDNTEFKTPDRRHLKLDFSRVAAPKTNIDPTPSTSASENQENNNRNSLTTTDDSSVFLSPCDDNMSCDSWSVCSDYHTQDLLLSPASPNGHMYSGDESESVIDRIRRKSFYTRFNEKKRPRRTSATGNYRDLDLYKDYNSQRKPGNRLPGDYGSLDRRSVDYRSPSDRRSSYNSVPDPVKKEYKPYVRSSSLLNDYVNVPNRYQTYNPRMNRHISSLYSPEIEDSAVDDNSLSTGKSRKNSYHYQPSRIISNRASSLSPCNNDNSFISASTLLNQNAVKPPNSQTSV